MQRPIIGEGVSPDVTPNSAPLGGRGHLTDLCDDEAVPLICPTRQVSAQSVPVGDRLLLCMGLFSIFLARAAATRRDRQTSHLKAHMLARPSPQRSGAPRPMKMGTTASPWHYDAGACHTLDPEKPPPPAI